NVVPLQPRREGKRPAHWNPSTLGHRTAAIAEARRQGIADGITDEAELKALVAEAVDRTARRFITVNIDLDDLQSVAVEIAGRIPAHLVRRLGELLVDA